MLLLRRANQEQEEDVLALLQERQAQRSELHTLQRTLADNPQASRRAEQAEAELERSRAIVADLQERLSQLEHTYAQSMISVERNIGAFLDQSMAAEGTSTVHNKSGGEDDDSFTRAVHNNTRSHAALGVGGLGGLDDTSQDTLLQLQQLLAGEGAASPKAAGAAGRGRSGYLSQSLYHSPPARAAGARSKTPGPKPSRSSGKRVEANQRALELERLRLDVERLQKQKEDMLAQLAR